MTTDAPPTVRIATWNLNHRACKRRVKPLFVDAALALEADVLCFTEYVPRTQHAALVERFGQAGYPYHAATPVPSVAANQVLVVSRHPLEPAAIERPAFEEYLASNVLGVQLP
jgi:hypothetical protein